MRILIIDDDRVFRRWLRYQVGAACPEAAVVDHEPSGREPVPPEFDPARWNLVFVGHAQVGEIGMEWIGETAGRDDLPPVVVLTEPDDEAQARTAIEAGAADFLPRERTSHDHVFRIVREALRAGRRMPRVGPRPDVQAAAPDFVLKGHRFVRTLARGVGSSVYLMENEARGEAEVVKVFRQLPDVTEGPGQFNRFLREYEAISGIEHPNLVRINDLGVSDDFAYIAMEYFPGGDLGDRIARGMTPQEALEALEQIAAGLEAVHAVGVLHRDLKPGNVMLRSDGSIALIDFGLAKLRDTPLDITVRGEIFGTPYYMSPEQGHGQYVDERSDLYSAGIVLFEMLSGRKPYVAASPMSVIWKHRHAPLPKLPPEQASLQSLLDRLLAKEPAARYASATELLAAIAKLRTAEPVSPEGAGEPDPEATAP